MNCVGNINKSFITDKCPRCGAEAYAEGVDVGIGYVHEPLHCECGWSELCWYESEDTCRKCDMNDRCLQINSSPTKL